MEAKFHRNEKYPIFLRGKIVTVCELLLKEKIGVIAGSRELVSLSSKFFDKHDEDFLPFVAIDSETDHLPVDWERGNWSEEALKRKDVEISEYEAAAKQDVFTACRNLISRFDLRD